MLLHSNKHWLRQVRAPRLGEPFTNRAILFINRARLRVVLLASLRFVSVLMMVVRAMFVLSHMRCGLMTVMRVREAQQRVQTGMSRQRNRRKEHQAHELEQLVPHVNHSAKSHR